MEEFTYIKDAKLDRQKKPSHWEGAPKYLPITRLNMTCGGGVGGSNWYEYVYRVDNIPSNTIMEFIRYDGKQIKINTTYIVGAEDFKLATARLNISEWATATKSYNNDTIETYRVLIDDNAELKLMTNDSEKFDESLFMDLF